MRKMTGADKRRFIEQVQSWDDSADSTTFYADYHWEWLAEAGLLDHMAKAASARAEGWHRVAIEAAARRDGTTRNCETCGAQFAAARADARFCSSACRQKAYRARAG